VCLRGEIETKRNNEYGTQVPCEVKKKQNAADKTHPDAFLSQGDVQKGMATRMRCTERVAHPLSQGGWVAMLLSALLCWKTLLDEKTTSRPSQRVRK
jgi:hypothetical protein